MLERGGNGGLACVVGHDRRGSDVGYAIETRLHFDGCGFRAGAGFVAAIVGRGLLRWAGCVHRDRERRG